jgi:hypothetical protein
MGQIKLSFLQLVLKTMVVHTVTYFVVGMLAFWLLDYRNLFAETELSLLMRQTDDPWVMAGPLFQPIRGFLFGVVLFLLRDALFIKRQGWLVMWLTLMILGFFSTFGPTPGSIEGVVYTTLPPWLHAMCAPEILLQSLLLSLIVCFWVQHPEKKWISWSFGIAFFVVLALPTLGLLVSK